MVHERYMLYIPSVGYTNHLSFKKVKKPPIISSLIKLKHIISPILETDIRASVCPLVGGQRTHASQLGVFAEWKLRTVPESPSMIYAKALVSMCS